MRGKVASGEEYIRLCEEHTAYADYQKAQTIAEYARVNME